MLQKVFWWWQRSQRYSFPTLHHLGFRSSSLPLRRQLGVKEVWRMHFRFSSKSDLLVVSPFHTQLYGQRIPSTAGTFYLQLTDTRREIRHDPSFQSSRKTFMFSWISSLSWDHLPAMGASKLQPPLPPPPPLSPLSPPYFFDWHLLKCPFKWKKKQSFSSTSLSFLLFYFFYKKGTR